MRKRSRDEAAVWQRWRELRPARPTTCRSPSHPTSFASRVDPVGPPLQEPRQETRARMRVVDDGVRLAHARSLLLEVASKFLGHVFGTFHRVHEVLLSWSRGA